MSVTLVLNTIRCVTTSEPNLDELFLTYAIDGGEPARIPEPPGSYHQLGQGGDWRLYHAFAFERELVITLWEADSAVRANDQLGQARYTPDSLPEQTTVSGDHSGEYVLITTLAGS